MSVFTTIRKTKEGLYKVQVHDNEGHLTPWSIPVKYAELKKWLKRKNLTAPNVKDLTFLAQTDTTDLQSEPVENIGKMWGREVHKDEIYNY